MGQILKNDFVNSDGADAIQKMKEIPENAEYFAGFMKEFDCSDLDVKGLSPQEIIKIGNDYYDGSNGMSYDPKTANKYYQAAAEMGHINAMLKAAHQYKNASYPFYTKALHWFKKAADLGSIKGMYCAGEMYEQGEGVEQDYLKAAAFYENAGNCDNSEYIVDNGYGYKINYKSKALNSAGILYYFGAEGILKNHQKAVEYFKKAVSLDKEDYLSNYYLGIAYLRGESIEKDYEKAFSCFNTAVQLGQPAALGCVDYMFEKGLVKNSQYKTAQEWFTGTVEYGKAAEQLGYVLVYRDSYIPEMSDYHRKIFNLMPDDSQVKKIIFDNEDGYDKGILWYEASAEKNFESALFSLINIYNYNKDNNFNKKPEAGRIAHFINKMFPSIGDKSKKIVFTKNDSDDLIEKMLGLSLLARREGLLSLRDSLDEEENIFIKTGKKLISDGIDSYIIKTILEFMLDIDNKKGDDLKAAKIIVHGIFSIQSGDNAGVTKLKLFNAAGMDLKAQEEEWKKINDKSEIAGNYYERGTIYHDDGKTDEAIADFEKALELTEDDYDKEKYRNRLLSIYEKKQEAQTLEERMAPYAQLTKKIKSDETKTISEIACIKKTSDYVDLGAALAFFEEYEILKRLLDESSESPLLYADSLKQQQTNRLSILNIPVSMRFSFWGPTPLYFITIMNTWSAMKDPKKTLKFLIDNGADIDAKAADGSTALSNQLYRNGSLEKLQILLELGADPNKVSLNGEVEWTPLIQCLIPDFTEDEKSLCTLKEINVKQARLLLEHGADPNLVTRDLTENSPLIMAIKYGYITEYVANTGERAAGIFDLIKLFIEKGANINSTDFLGNTPLSIAKDNNLSEIENLLLEHGALLPDELEESDDDGRYDGQD